MIDDLRNEDDEDLGIQCNVFDDEKQADDEAYASLNPVGVDINDHNAVFNSLYEKVCNQGFIKDTLLLRIGNICLKSIYLLSLELN